MPISLERIAELLELDVSQFSEEDKARLLSYSRKSVDEEGEQYLSENRELLKLQFEYIQSM
ncbi:unnamed protein product [marine sediment metagenome]|uniref:Uncharacterized protein n=1 Tax=marine sediment metagenome TaxID=412755 RepID=X1RV63_9ZZZZ